MSKEPLEPLSPLLNPIARLIELDRRESAIQSERVMRLSLYEAAILALPDALIACNHEGEIVLFNPTAELMFGYSEEAVFGRPLEMLLPEAARERHRAERANFSRFARTDRHATMGVGLDLQGQHRDGTIFPLDITLSRFKVSTGLYNLAVVRYAVRRMTFADPGGKSDDAERGGTG